VAGVGMMSTGTRRHIVGVYSALVVMSRVHHVTEHQVAADELTRRESW
jgi:hypothetical protein